MGEERDYDREHEHILFDSNMEKLNETQIAYFNAAVAVVESHKQNP